MLLTKKKNRCKDQQDRKESPEMNPYFHGQLMRKDIQLEKDISSTNGMGKLDSNM